ncbi:MAG TPA: hypothetical protein VJ694_04690 [Patescibacteria group bacterium]|nr:hypothetical protein [Patescibacteria group bacterium]
MDNSNKHAEYVVTAYAYFERRMRELCAERTGISGPMDADEARKLIHRHAPMKLPGGKLWWELMMLKKISNVLRENAGRLEEHALLHYCRKAGIADEEGAARSIRVTPEYSDRVRKLVLEFFQALDSMT